MPRVISLFTEAANYNKPPTTLSKYYKHRNYSASGEVQALAFRLMSPRLALKSPSNEPVL